MLSSEGDGLTCTIYEMAAGKSLRFGKVGKSPEERPSTLGEPGELTFSKKATAK